MCMCVVYRLDSSYSRKRHMDSSGSYDQNSGRSAKESRQDGMDYMRGSMMDMSVPPPHGMAPTASYSHTLLPPDSKR